jgi:hypothetical protein
MEKVAGSGGAAGSARVMRAERDRRIAEARRAELIGNLVRRV